jgi:hypothetical protein
MTAFILHSRGVRLESVSGYRISRFFVTLLDPKGNFLGDSELGRNIFVPVFSSILYLQFVDIRESEV